MVDLINKLNINNIYTIDFQHNRACRAELETRLVCRNESIG